METITVNVTGKTRREKMSGRAYIVAPLSLIVPGVLNGSDGALYYPFEEIERNPADWNHMPIVVYHPMQNGKPVTARKPEIIDKHGIGLLFNTNASGKLASEGWFEEEATRRVDVRVYEALEANRLMELSTGLNVRKEPADTGATYNGKPYKYIARDYRPDHLAILPDEIGACSLLDGCGMNVSINKARCGCGTSFCSCKLEEAVLVNRTTRREGSTVLTSADYAYVPDPNKPSTWKLRIDDVTHVAGAIGAIGKGFRGNKVIIPKSAMPGVKAKIRKAWLKFHKDKSEKDLPEILTNTSYELELRKQDEELTVSELSYSDREDQVRTAYYDTNPVKYDPVTGNPSRCYVVSVYEDYLIYMENGELYRQSYSISSSGKVSFEDDAEAVRKEVNYVPIED